MASNEKHKKGFISVFYKSSTGNTKQKSEPTAVTNKIVSRSSWFTKKPKAKSHIGDLKGQRLPDGKAGGGFVQGRRSASEVEQNLSSLTGIFRGGGNAGVGGGGGSCGGGRGGDGEVDLVVQGRKSVSHVEQARKSVSHVEQARKSVSHIEESARKSVSHIENNLPSMANLQVRVLVSDMPGFMQVHAFQCARKTYDSLEDFSSKHMAYNLKKEFDKVYGPAWHCIVGSSFGSFVTHSTGCFLYFSMENLYILVFRTKVKRVSD